MSRISVAILLYLIVVKVDVLASWSPKEPTGPIVTGVRTTAYTYGATENGAYPSSNAIGKPLKTGKVRSAAADWSRWPLGTRFRVMETGQEYVVDDIGSAMVGTGTIDLFKPSSREMSRWGVRKVTIEILEWGSPEKSLEILLPRKKSRHVREMLNDLLALRAV
jgi:3D (Asp-Asp-Asp) domain-containing protein